MATKKSVEQDVIPASVNQALNSIAKGLGVAAIELWSIFVRQYVVRGLAEAFTALLLFGLGIFLWQFVTWWAFIPLGIGVIFAYGAILMLGNPKYYAITDITGKVQGFSADKLKDGFLR